MTSVDFQLQISRQVSLRRDQNTKELALLLSAELFALSGQYPHVVINNLSRKKMDANRDIDIAAFGVPEAESAWEQYHRCISQAVETIHHRGLYVDLHGQNHAEKWVELGYLIPAKHLDEENFNPSQSSIYNLAVHKSMEDVNAFKELLYGASSLGALMDKEGLKVVPSPSYHSPSGGNYFCGGYNTMRYGSQSSAVFDAIQIESPKILRAKGNISSYAKTLAKCLHSFIQMHY